MLVDDFLTDDTKGDTKLVCDTSTTKVAHDKGSMVGSNRRTRLGAIVRQEQPASLLIGPGPNDTGRLLVSTGVDTLATAELSYGIDENNRPVPLNLNVAEFDRFRIDFSFVDFAVNVNVVVFTPQGWSACGHNVDQFLTPATVGDVFTQDFLFADFGGPGRGFEEVDTILAIFSFFGPIGGNDYQIEGIRLEAGPAPAG